MDDNVTFRVENKNTPQTTTDRAVKNNEPTTVRQVDEDVPYTAYHSEHKHPFLADYFELGDHWDEFDEIMDIEGYFKEQVERGLLDNKQGAIKEKLKQIEKMVNLDKTTRQVVKIAKVSAYIKFLREVENIERTNNKYGSTRQ